MACGNRQKVFYTNVTVSEDLDSRSTLWVGFGAVYWSSGIEIYGDIDPKLDTIKFAELNSFYYGLETKDFVESTISFGDYYTDESGISTYISTEHLYDIDTINVTRLDTNLMVTFEWTENGSGNAYSKANTYISTEKLFEEADIGKTIPIMIELV